MPDTMPHAPTPSPETAAELPAYAVPPDRRPRHIAVIMDGNGRWAVQRNQPRIAGHRAGARAVREVLTECSQLGIEALTLFSFSSENWKRPRDEVNALMGLYLEYLVQQREELIDSNVRFMQIGRRDGLPPRVLEQVDETAALTSHCTGIRLVVALNYGSRAEITDAVRSIARKVRSGEIDIDAIDEDTVAAHLYTAGLPDPDLLIRTAGEQRVSNYLLWQISYAEIHVTDVLWPDFTATHLHAAICDFAERHRRFGGVDDPGP